MYLLNVIIFNLTGFLVHISFFIVFVMHILVYQLLQL